MRETCWHSVKSYNRLVNRDIFFYHLYTNWNTLGIYYSRIFLQKVIYYLLVISMCHNIIHLYVIALAFCVILLHLVHVKLQN